MCRVVRRLLVLAGLATAAGPVAALGQDAGKAAPRSQAAQVARPKAAPAPTGAADSAQANPADPRMKQLLAAWEKQSSKIKNLDVTIHRIDTSPAWGSEEFKGRALLMSPNLAWLDFAKVDPDDPKKDPIKYERIICTGTEVWQYVHKVKQVFIFPLDKQNKQRALEEGPLPFLFNMKAAEAEARYLMALVNETEKFFVISVVPRLKVDREAFSKAFVQLNRTTSLPDRIMLISPDGTSKKDFRLVKVDAKTAVNPANFKGIDPGPPWQIIRDPGGDGPPPARPQQGVVKRQAPTPPGAVPPRNATGPLRRPPAN